MNTRVAFVIWCFGLWPHCWKNGLLLTNLGAQTGLGGLGPRREMMG